MLLPFQLKVFLEEQKSGSINLFGLNRFICGSVRLLPLFLPVVRFSDFSFNLDSKAYNTTTTL